MEKQEKYSPGYSHPLPALLSRAKYGPLKVVPYCTIKVPSILLLASSRIVKIHIFFQVCSSSNINIIWATTWESVPSDMWAQRRLESALHLHSLISLHYPHEDTLHPWLSKMCPAKIQISLRKDSDQPAQWGNWSESLLDDLHRLIWILAGCSCPKVRFLMLWFVFFPRVLIFQYRYIFLFYSVGKLLHIAYLYDCWQFACILLTWKSLDFYRFANHQSNPPFFHCFTASLDKTSSPFVKMVNL